VRAMLHSRRRPKRSPDHAHNRKSLTLQRVARTSANSTCGRIQAKPPLAGTDRQLSRGPLRPATGCSIARARDRVQGALFASYRLSYLLERPQYALHECATLEFLMKSRALAFDAGSCHDSAGVPIAAQRATALCARPHPSFAPHDISHPTGCRCILVGSISLCP
jgi:hypothetical protein